MKLRLGTFNLFQFVEPPYSYYKKTMKFNKKQWLEKITWIKNQIIEMDCDIIGFQEVFSCDALKDIVQELGFKYFETVDFAKLCDINKTTYISTTVAIASKYPITNIQKVKDELCDFSRVPIRATIALPNEYELLVYVCHLKSNRLNKLCDKYLTVENQRLCEASSLYMDIKKSKSKSIVLLGDLNDKEFSITIDALSNNKYHDDNAKEEFVLYDASYQYTENISNPHCESKKKKRKPTSYFAGKGDVLDYIFISSDFIKINKDRMAEVTEYIVLNNHLRQYKNGSLVTSDHAQVVCELTFNIGTTK